MYLLGVADLRASTVDLVPGELAELRETATVPNGTVAAAYADPAPTAAWWTLAACRGLPTEWWYPERGTTFAVARAICAGCPVAEPCLESARAEESAIALMFHFGMRGGLSAAERATSSSVTVGAVAVGAVSGAERATTPVLVHRGSEAGTRRP